VYQYRSLSIEALVALYSICDVALVTPLRDGMNLIAKEYVASRAEKNGVLILSEMAGAARELGEAIIVNPNSREEIASALIEALTMPAAEQRRRMEIMQARLRRFDLAHWAQGFLAELASVRPERARILAKLLGDAESRVIVEHFRHAQRRLVVLDFDGTLVPITADPRDTKPSGALLSLLAGLTSDPSNEVVLISGRDRTSLHNWFAWLPIGLAAEHGVWLKKRGQEWRLARQRSIEWKAKLKPILDMYAERLPGALVEEKEYSLVWHYRRADVEQGVLVARALTDDLLNFTGNIDVQVVQGRKSVEVRSSGVGKAAALRHWLRDQEFDFALAIGDEHDDEELFAALPPHGYSIRVGIVRTGAQFNLREPKDVIKLLEELRWAQNPPKTALHHSL